MHLHVFLIQSVTSSAIVFSDVTDKFLSHLFGYHCLMFGHSVTRWITTTLVFYFRGSVLIWFPNSFLADFMIWAFMN